MHRDAAEVLALQRLRQILSTYRNFSPERQRQFIADSANAMDTILYRLHTPATKPAPETLEHLL